MRRPLAAAAARVPAGQGWRCRSCGRRPRTAEQRARADTERTRFERYWIRELGSREAAVELAQGIWGA